MNLLHFICLFVTEDTPTQTHAIVAIMAIAGVALIALLIYAHVVGDNKRKYEEPRDVSVLPRKSRFRWLRELLAEMYDRTNKVRDEDLWW